ncbi:hypothetical protein KCU65_g5944, partial [Aureobasidium melanogenum]
MEPPDTIRIPVQSPPDYFRRFERRSVSLTFSGVRLHVEGQNDYGTLVAFLQSLQRWRMLAHLKFKRITIWYRHEDDNSDLGWLNTPLQFEKDKYEWNTATGLRLGLDDLIHRFGNNVGP